jgi:hypothetical protein
MPAESGYSGTPLPRKLGIPDGGTICVVGDPGNARDLIVPLPAAAGFDDDPRAADVVIFFVTDRTLFEEQVERLGQAVFPDRSLWIAWPKSTSGVTTNMTENVVREIALPRGLVDNKVCAVDATWSALRLVWRRELRH